MSNAVAERLRPFGTTIFAEMTRLAVEHDAVNLSQGFPDFDGPAFIREAAKHAIDTGHNQYARPAGEPALVGAIATSFSERTGLACDAMAEVTVTSGCTEAIAATMLGLVNPGDEVVLFEPFYDSYRACVAMAGAVPKTVAMRPARGSGGMRYAFDEAELRAAFGPKTRAVLVNTPHNPTGSVLTREELGVIASLATEHDAIVIADEVYEHLVYEGEHVSIAALPGMAERTVTLSSLGKTFSLTGWKIGWAIAPPQLTAGVRAAHQFLTFAVSTPMQHAAAEAIMRGQAEIDALLARYRDARSMLAETLDRVGFDVIMPAGSYFIMAGHERVSERLGIAAHAEKTRQQHDVALSLRLIRDVGVATIPPSVFCVRPEVASGSLRFAFCKKPETLREAARRLEPLVRGGGS